MMCAVQGNDMMMAVYLASMMRAVVSLHALIENKEMRMWTDKKSREAKEKENADANGAEQEGGKVEGEAAEAEPSKKP
jgi:26S proteasome regulatory subunit N8